MKNRLSLFAAATIAISSWPGFACPPAGVYDLYNGEGINTGQIVSTLTISSSSETPVLQVRCTTKMEYPQVSAPYRFTETDAAEIGNEGLLSFHRESDENGKKAAYSGERRGKNLEIRYEREGRKFSTAAPLSTFDLTDFEVEAPGSKFRRLKAGESKTLRVFALDRMEVVSVARNVAALRDFPYREKNVPVLVVTTLVRGKISTSWYDAKTGDLLQEEGTDYLMSRVTP